MQLLIVAMQECATSHPTGSYPGVLSSDLRAWVGQQPRRWDFSVTVRPFLYAYATGALDEDDGTNDATAYFCMTLDNLDKFVDWIANDRTYWQPSDIREVFDMQLLLMHC